MQRVQQHDYLYSEAELAEWAKRIEHVSRFADSTFVIFNNDAQGKSVVNALQLQSMMGGGKGDGSQGASEEVPDGVGEVRGGADRAAMPVLGGMIAGQTSYRNFG